MLSENNSMWSYDRGKGFTLENATIDDSFGYDCIGTMNNKTSEEIFNVIVYGISKVSFIHFHLIKIIIWTRENKIGLEVTKLGGSDDPLEGSNVTLLCRTFVAEQSADWYQINSEFEEPILLNTTDLPEGLRECHQNEKRNKE